MGSMRTKRRAVVVVAVALSAGASLGSGACGDGEPAAGRDASTEIDASWVDAVADAPGAENDAPADDADGETGSGAVYDYGFDEIALGGDPRAVTELRFVPGTTDEFILLEKEGRVLHYRLAGDGATAALLGAFNLSVSAASDCGLLSLAFDPGFEANRVLYFGYCISPTHSRISRHVLDTTDYAATAAGVEVITVGDDAAPTPWHNVGSMGFDGAGRLWAVFGDKNLNEPAQDAASALGALVRVVPRADGGAGYDVPEDNPYAADGSKHGAVYAKGLRSPWRATLDTHGRWFVGDVGGARIEEVDMIAAPGQNFGWPLHEGACGADCGGTVPPLIAWDRSLSHPFALEDPRTPRSTRRVVWVGPEYRDRGSDRYAGRLTGHVLYGEFCSGWVRAVRVPLDGGAMEDGLLAHLESISSWDQAPDGYLYAVTYGSCAAFPYLPGRMWRLRPGAASP